MATYNVELRQRISGTFGDTIYLKANWNNLDNKPSTFTPTAHTHGNVSNDGKIGSTAGLIIKTGTSGLLEALAAGSSGQFLGHDGTWKDLPAISLAEGYGDSINPYASKTAKYVLAAPNATNGSPTFRLLVASDIPALAYRASTWVPSWTDVTSKPTTFAPIIGSGAADAVAGNDSRLTDARSASDVYAWAKAATKPAYTNTEVGAAATSHAHGSITTDGKIGTTANLIVQTGTGGALTTKAAGTTAQFLRGDGSWATPPDNQGVTSVAGTLPIASSGGTTPTISLAANYGDTQNPFASKTAKYFLAAPNAAAGAPTFRAIVASDIPTLNQNTTGSSGSTTGNAATATKLATTRAITVGPTAKNFDGSAAITYTLAEIGINVVTTCPVAAATAGQINVYTGAACATKYANWLYFET